MTVPGRGAISARRAAERRHIRVERALIAKDADPAVADKKGRTPLDLAREAKAAEIVALLEGALATQRRAK